MVKSVNQFLSLSLCESICPSLSLSLCVFLPITHLSFIFLLLLSSFLSSCSFCLLFLLMQWWWWWCYCLLCEGLHFFSLKYWLKRKGWVWSHAYSVLQFFSLFLFVLLYPLYFSLYCNYAAGICVYPATLPTNAPPLKQAIFIWLLLRVFFVQFQTKDITLSWFTEMWQLGGSQPVAIPRTSGGVSATYFSFVVGKQRVDSNNNEMCSWFEYLFNFYWFIFYLWHFCSFLLVGMG